MLKYTREGKSISAKHLITNKWDEKGADSFDITMGAYSEEEICELASSFLLHQPPQKLDKTNFSLRRDDGLALLKNISEPELKKIKTLFQCFFFHEKT